MKKLGDDTGGMHERFIFTAPARCGKDMDTEEQADLNGVTEVYKVYQLVVAFHKEERVFVLDKEANTYLNEVMIVNCKL